MSITTALYTGISGLQTLGNALQVTGHNIANANTVGYKSSRTEFSDLLSQSINIGGKTAQLGRGVRLDDVSRSFAQGSFQNTDSVMDMAINGRGFFILSDGVQTFYTRAGNFHTDEAGNLVNSNGLGVQGFLYDPTGQPTGTRGAINLTNLITPPHATGDGASAGSGVTISANLSSDAPVAAFDIADPSGTSNYSTSATVYDSLGAAHSVILYFNKTADSAWAWHAVIDGGDLTGGTAGTPQECATGTLTFDTSGALQTQTTTSTDFDFGNGAVQNQAIGFRFGDAIGDGGTGLSGTTQFDGPYVTNYVTQDGYATGNLQAIAIDREGKITGIFTNGRTRIVAQLALANFQNEQGLLAMGSNQFVETVDSGQPTVSAPNVGALGEVVGNSLELSNVDLATEFVTMITTQRAFQANSRTITVGNDMMQDVVNLIR
ncbi:MAG: flagellar hook protein FlgE [Candidatus Sumerlaeota bacterium]|nr:flagellar hook protein FlgE [Candidatus Sumerlaeota bacterium]